MRMLSRIWQVIREEPLLVTVGFILRKLTCERISLHHFFEADLNGPVVSDSAKPAASFQVSVYEGEEQLNTVLRLLRASTVSPDLIKRRLARGDLVSVVTAGNETAGFTWMNVSGSHWVSELGLDVHFGEHEAVQYESFVFPEWRGRGLQFVMNVPMLQRARGMGIQRTLAYVNALNTRSLKNQRRYKKKQVLSVWNFHLWGGLNWNLVRGSSPHWQFRKVSLDGAAPHCLRHSGG